MRYTTKSHVITTAQAAGSTAKTYKGAAKYLIAHAANKTPLHKRGNKCYTYYRNAACLKSWLTRERYTERYEAKGSAIMAAAGLWPLDRALAALELAHQADMATRIIIPLGSETAAEMRRAARAEYPHRKNWDSPAALKESVGYGVRDWNHGRYSSRCTYIHYTYEPRIGSWARIEGNALEYHYGDDLRTGLRLAPPRGYRWDRDAQGIRLVSLSRPGNDYHPDSDDLRAYSPSKIRAKLLALAETRKAQARAQGENLERLSPDQFERRIKRAIREGVKVCLIDALKAGNCRAGVTTFATQRNLDPKRHYRPDVLLRVAGDSLHRVKLAVIYAIRRHAKEMKAGYAQLTDHYETV